MGKDEQLHVSDIKLAGSIKVLTDAEQVVCKVEEIQEELPAAEEGAATEPEVLSDKKEEAPAEEAK
ncbi:MAG: hypothetical protein QM762_13020 [Chryseolinea sp.]